MANLILFTLEKIVEGGEMIMNSSADLRRWIYEVYGDYPRSINNLSLSQAIRRLREKGLLEQEKREVGEIVLRLTQKGREFALLVKDDKEWDGRWRIVIFDIPESKRVIRNVLRRRLKSWGFVAWQKSVWASKKNLTRELRALVEELSIGNWVKILESDNVGF